MTASQVPCMFALYLSTNRDGHLGAHETLVFAYEMHSHGKHVLALSATNKDGAPGLETAMVVR